MIFIFLKCTYRSFLPNSAWASHLCHGQQLSELLSSSNLAMRSYGPDTDFQYVCTVTLTLKIGSRSWHSWVSNNKFVKYYQRSNFAVRSYGPDTYFRYMCNVILTLEIWPLVKVMTHPKVMGMWNIQIQHGSEELWPRHRFWLCVHCDLDLGDMTLGQGHDTPLSHGQQLCEILSRSDRWVLS